MYLLIGDFDPDDIAAQTGIRPVTAQRKGDLGRNFRPLKDSVWQLTSSLDRSEPLDAHLRSLLAQMQPAWDVFVHLGRQHHAYVDCPAYLSDNTSIALIFDRDIVQRIAELNAGIGIDWYWWGSGEPETQGAPVGEAMHDRRLDQNEDLAVVLVARIPDYDRIVASGSDQAAERTARLLAHAETIAAREHGHRIESRADQVILLFSGPRLAWRAALALSQPPPWPAPRSEDRASIGLEIGDVALVGETHASASLHLAEAYARLAGPGEILTSAAVARVAREQGIPFVHRGMVQLQGFADPVEIVQLLGAAPEMATE